MCIRDRSVEYVIRENGKEVDHFSQPAFLVELLGHTWLITAGHVIQDVLSRAERGQSVESYLVDWLDPEPTLPGGVVPFDVLTRDGIGMGPRPGERLKDSVGTDYAAYLLDENTRQLLTTRTDPGLRVCPVGVVEDFEHGFIVGTVNEGQEGCVSIVLRPLEFLPDDDPDTLKVLEMQENHARGLVKAKVADDWDLTIKGMSGGPVFGARHLPNGTSEIAVVGVQSSWAPRLNVILAHRIAADDTSIPTVESLLRTTIKAMHAAAAE